jgi:hypothetical protein
MTIKPGERIILEVNFIHTSNIVFAITNTSKWMTGNIPIFGSHGNTATIVTSLWIGCL